MLVFTFPHPLPQERLYSKSSHMRVQAKIAEKCSFVGLETLVRSSHPIFPRCASRETQRNVNLQGQASAQRVSSLYIRNVRMIHQEDPDMGQNLRVVANSCVV